MLLARYAPIGSDKFKRLSNNVNKYDKLIQWIPAQLFGIWTIFVAGMASGKNQLDRYYFWDWNSWIIGIIGLIAITIIFKVLKDKFKLFPYNKDRFTFSDGGYHWFMPIILSYLGFVLKYGFGSLVHTIVYVLPYFAIFMVYTIKIDEKTNSIFADSNKHIKSVFIIILLVITVVLGFWLDDPVLATGAAVILPFIVVLLFGKRARHLERARFYPIFIFTMFVISREAWFILPVLMLFFTLRTYNYLRHQKMYPTFGVSDDSN